jgi:hypothetical protein
MNWAFLFCLCFLAQESFSATVSAQRIAEFNRLIPLKKITVGPDDQYHGVVDPSGRWLVFTKKTDLVPHLCRQDLKTGEVTELVPLSADSQEGTFGSDGKLAFTYYKFNARGDICYKVKLGEDSIRCLKANAAGEKERSSPFWISSGELGYLERDMKTLATEIVAEKISSGERKVLVSGRVWSPSMKSGGKYLFYNELRNEGQKFSRSLVQKNLASGVAKEIQLALPGISGFPSVSQDEKYLLFSHYLNDTNNDNIIDGTDNSVVFRLPIRSTDDETNPVLPEQLTSAEHNCSFSQSYKDQLYVTCAFEGYLDVYQLPASGVVPRKWDKSLLLNAHRTARSYEERVLVLNTIKWRFGNGNLIEKQLLSNHFLAGDISAASYYLEDLNLHASKEEKSSYELLGIYFRALGLRKGQPSEEQVSPSFQKEVLRMDSEMVKVAGNLRLKKILRGCLRIFLNEPEEAESFFSQIEVGVGKDKQSVSMTPVEWYFYFELAQWTARFSGTSRLYTAYQRVIGAPEVSEETRIFYAFHFLEALERGIPSREDRISFLERFDHELPESIADLLSAESSELKIILARDDKAKGQEYTALNKLLTRGAKNYFLRKAMYVRAILNFAASADLKYLDFIAANWLSYTKKDDTEFSYAREVYVNSSLDRAYEKFGKKDYALASGFFYGSLILTDDLESHYGYINSMVLRKERKVVDTRYANLYQRHITDDNIKYVQALLKLIDGNSDLESINAAIQSLDAMELDRDSAGRYLLLGYCNVQKLLLTANGYDFEHDLFESAHRNLMLAYDAGKDNIRVRAAALINLGILHQRVQNHGMAVRFLSKRKELGFTSEDESAHFEWLYARSLFYSNQPERAAKEISAVAGRRGGPWQERQAFYLMSAGNFLESVKIYDSLLKNGAITGDKNLAKANLSMGYGLVKLGRVDEGRDRLLKSIQFAERLSVLEKGGSRLIDFEPIRLKLDAYGILGQVGSVSDRTAALEKRGQWLELSKGLFEDRLSLSIQNRLQLANLCVKTDPVKAVQKLNEGLVLAEELADSGQPLSHALYRFTVDYLAVAVIHPDLFDRKDAIRIKRVMETGLRAYRGEAQPMLAYQKAKLQLLWAAYTSTPSLGEIKKIVDSVPPNFTPEIQALAEALSPK